MDTRSNTFRIPPLKLWPRDNSIAIMFLVFVAERSPRKKHMWSCIGPNKSMPQGKNQNISSANLAIRLI